MTQESYQLQDRHQFEEVFTRYYIELVMYVCKYLKEVSLSEDLVQELFCSLWAKRKSLIINTSVRGFLFQAARNSAYNYLTRTHKITVELTQELENEVAFKEDVETIERDRKLYN